MSNERVIAYRDQRYVHDPLVQVVGRVRRTEAEAGGGIVPPSAAAIEECLHDSRAGGRQYMALFDRNQEPLAVMSIQTFWLEGGKYGLIDWSSDYDLDPDSVGWVAGADLP